MREIRKPFLPLSAFLLVALFANASLVFGGESPGRLGRADFFGNHSNAGLPIDMAVSGRALLFQGESQEEKSVFKAVVLSLILPGMGELYAKGFESGKYFLIAESGLWLTFTSFEVYGNWVQNDARRFAASHASAQVDDKDDQFFVNIGNFANVYDYNEKKLRDRDLGSLYDSQGSFYWQWDSEQSRSRFRDLRVKSDNILNNVRFVTAAIIVNHIASAINAARLAIGWNREILGLQWDLLPGAIGPTNDPTGLVLNLRKNF